LLPVSVKNKKGDLTFSDSDEKPPKNDANTEDIVETNISETISNKVKSRH
jgi:hypothetical protein